MPETRPAPAPKDESGRLPVTRIVTNATFAGSTLCNMFIIGILVIFGANFAFITGQSFGFNASVNGVVLALFNGSIALGTYLAGRLLPRFGAHRATVGGAVACTAGWLAIMATSSLSSTSLPILVPFLVAAAAGCGIVMALCSGAALTPFTHQSGTASSLYLLIQSAGSCAISLSVGLLLPKEITTIALAMAACAAMAVLSKLLIRGKT